MPKKIEFPKCVYGFEGEWKTVHSVEEIPEGWSDRPGGDPVAITEEVLAEANEAKKAAEAAAKEHREALKEFLDEHEVEYAPNLGTPKLEELVEKLKAHLAAPQPSVTTPR